ncbi:MAG: fibronectin type III domain-containing protein [Oscillospiraceae bacterium]|nr:fibronectin type III domain-containing protein [Oscillospiraceae bacterium]
MKKLFAMLLAGLLIITSMSVAVWADDDDTIIDDSFDSYTYAEFRDKVVSASEADEVLSSELAFRSYGKRQMGIYLPEGIELEDITEIIFYPSYLAVGFDYDDVYVQLFFYNSTYGESSAYTNAKEGGQELVADDGTSVYNYISLSNEYYYWLDGDKTFCLCVRSTEHQGEFLSLCKAVFHSFDEEPTISLEATVSNGKVKLTWDEIVDDSTYTVYWKRSSSDEWQVAGTTSKQKVSISGLKSGISYDFKIEATGFESEVATVTA